MSARKTQYITSALFALGLIGVQVWAIVRRHGLLGLHPRTDVMQQQIVNQLGGDPALQMSLLGFVLLVVASHLALACGAVVIYRLAADVVLRGRRDSLILCFGFVAGAALLAMFANRWLFPLSTAFADIDLLMVQPLSPLLMAILVAVAASSLVCALYAGWKAATKPALLGGLAVMIMALLAIKHVSSPASPMGATERSPDVIILGVDSLRPDYLSTYGQMPAGLAPSIDSALQTSVALADARTPLARTFVSYQSLLTGKNPIHHGARFNLYPRSEFTSSDTLAWRLKAKGYHTVLAMDESRFANFDASFGFDTVVVPSVGALDFLVGGTFDFFATNLVIALVTPTAWMSPIQGNRAAFRSYRVDDHPKRLHRALGKLSQRTPLLLVSHLCLPHWPYLPGTGVDSRGLSWVKTVPGYEQSPEQYLRAVAAADTQFKFTIDELRRLGRLENAIVVVLSDHGEDFALERDRFRDSEHDQRLVGAHGHGSVALSPAQNHIVMGIQRYRDGKPAWTPRMMQGPASIIDVAPTIMDELGLGVSEYEGTSWLEALQQSTDLPNNRVRFFENGLRSAGVERPDIDEQAVAVEMAHLYRVTPDRRFEVRPELLAAKLGEKQRGAAVGRWGVMTDPVSSAQVDAGGCWQAVDYQHGVMRCVDFPAPEPAVAQLQKEVCRYYASDVGFAERWCRVSGDKEDVPAN